MRFNRKSWFARFLFAIAIALLFAFDASAGPFARRRAAASSCGSASAQASSCGSSASAQSASACGSAASAQSCGSAAMSAQACGSAVSAVTFAVDPPATIVFQGQTYQLVPLKK
jgi:hypothetical protein